MIVMQIDGCLGIMAYFSGVQEILGDINGEINIIRAAAPFVDFSIALAASSPHLIH